MTETFKPPRPSASGGDAGRARPRAVPHLPGEVHRRTHIEDAGRRDYELYVPASHREKPMPLLVMLHGGEQDAADFAAGTRMNQLADQHGFLVAYPEQSRDANRDGLWNWFRAGDQRVGEGEPSIIVGIVGQIQRDYVVDSERIYIAGLSAGGAMAAIVAVTYPELFAAVGVHSGLAYGAAQDLGSAILAMMTGAPGSKGVRSPLIVFHGDGDSIVAVSNAESLVSTSLSEAGLPSRKFEREAGVRIHSEGSRPSTRAVHTDAQGRVVVEAWIVHGGGHAWFGGSEDGSHTDPQGPDAAAEMIRFFLEQPALSP